MASLSLFFHCFTLPHLYSFSRVGTNTLVTPFPSLFTSPNKPPCVRCQAPIGFFLFLGLGFSLSYLFSSFLNSQFCPPNYTNLNTKQNPSRDFSLSPISDTISVKNMFERERDCTIVQEYWENTNLVRIASSKSSFNWERRRINHWTKNLIDTCRVIGCNQSYRGILCQRGRR